MGDRATAIKFYNQAGVALKDTNNPERQQNAYQMFASACMADTTWSEAHYQSGNNNSDMGYGEAAIACWRRALECEMTPHQRARVLANMGHSFHKLGKQDDAKRVLEEAIALNANDWLPWLNLSTVYQIYGDVSERLRTAETAYSLAPDNSVAEINYAFANLEARNLAKGFKHFECRYAYKLKSYLTFPYPKWEGQPDATIFLDSDQGMGDTLSFARFIPAAAKKAKYIHFCVQPELQSLFYNVFVGLPNVNIVPKPCGFLPADYWSTIVSLPYALGLTDEEIRHTPQFEPIRTHIPVNWRVPDRKFHIGIAWAGSEANDINKHRSIPVTQFYDLYRVPGVQLYALQCDNKREQLYGTGGAPAVVDLGRYVTNVVDTIALIRNLDLVICCESALGHIAACADKECWLPYSRLGKDYRLGYDGTDMLWTPKHRVFNQGPDLQWQPVFDQIVEALREKVDASLQPDAVGRVRAAVA